MHAENIGSVPKPVREHDFDLVNAAGKTDGNQPRGKSIPTNDGATRYREVPVEIHAEAASHASSAYVAYLAIGSVTGVLCDIGSKERGVFSIVNEETGRVVRGSYEDDLIDGFRNAFKMRVTVSGILYYGREGGIASIEAKAIRVEPVGVPKLSSLRGVLNG